MSLFDKIFRRKADLKTEYENLPSSWEDDYCQVELVPRKNSNHISQSVKEIKHFPKKTRTEYGFTGMYGREALPFPTINEEFLIDPFENLLTNRGWKKATKILYEGCTTIDCSNTTSNAFSLPFFDLFYDLQEEFVENIWIPTPLITSTEYLKNILNTLYELGEGYDLILIDWNSLELIDLADRNQIKIYLNDHSK